MTWDLAASGAMDHAAAEVKDLQVGDRVLIDSVKHGQRMWVRVVEMMTDGAGWVKIRIDGHDTTVVVEPSRVVGARDSGRVPVAERRRTDRVLERGAVRYPRLPLIQSPLFQPFGGSEEGWRELAEGFRHLLALERYPDRPRLEYLESGVWRVANTQVHITARLGEGVFLYGLPDEVPVEFTWDEAIERATRHLADLRRAATSYQISP